MANLSYVVIARDSTSNPAGKPITGLTPTWVFLKKLADGTNITPPAITEIGHGQYQVVFDPEANGDASGQIDLGSSLSNLNDRYTDLTFFMSESRSTFNLDAAVSTRSTFAGGAVASVTAPVTVGSNQDKAGYQLAASGLDAIPVEAGINVRQALAPILASAAGIVSGATTALTVTKGANTDVTRITAITDMVGNRPSVTLTLPS